MNRSYPVVIAACALGGLFNAPAIAQPGTLDPTFVPTDGPSMGYAALGLQPDGKVLTTVSFTDPDGLNSRRLERLNADGTIDPGYSVPAYGMNGGVLAILQQPDGKVIIGGTFQTFSGVPRSGIARVNADGTLDPTYTPAAHGPFVFALARQPDGKVLVGGVVGAYGATAHNIVRLNPDGSNDATFNPGGFGANFGVFSIAVLSDGKILIAGRCTYYNNIAISRKSIARLNSDGSLDMSFDPGTGFHGATSMFATDDVERIVLQPDGKVIAVGAFTHYNGTPRNGIVRINTDGSIDGTFDPGSGLVGPDYGGYARDIVLEPDGRMIVAGSFTTYNGLPANHLARILSDGTLDATFNAGTGPDLGVQSLALQPDGKVLVAGPFTTMNGTNRPRLARLFLDCSVNSDSDGDLVNDCFDLCPGDANKLTPGQCGCGAVETDTDGDLIADCVDGCPGDPNKTAPGACGCGIADIDGDNDGTANCNDGCPTDPSKIAPGVCGCGVADTDGDGDGVANCVDNCPAVSGQVGSGCLDGLVYTINDVLNSSCVCQGTPIPCPNLVTLTLQTDALGSQTTWQFFAQGTSTLIASGPLTPYTNAVATHVEQFCLPSGCYDLRVNDANGMGSGGYKLDVNGQRLIDNTGNGQFTTTSYVHDCSNASQGFCVPIGVLSLAQGCDQLDLTTASKIASTIDPAVTVVNSTSGYQFWIFDPNGNYSRRLFQNTADITNTAAPGGTPQVQKAAYLYLSKLNGATGCIPPFPGQKLLNVRIRSKLNNAWISEWGPACRIKIDPTAHCTTTQLTTTANPVVSCGAINVGLSTGVIWADPVVPAAPAPLWYRFAFTRGSQVLSKKSSTRNFNMSSWGSSTKPTCNLVYTVKVQVSFDPAALVWCDYGATCTAGVVFRCTPPGNGRELDEQPVSDVVHIWPNPNNGDQLFIRIDDLEEQIGTATVTITDVFGKQVMSEVVSVDGSAINTTLDLKNALSDGLYLVNIMVDERTFTERLVIVK